MSERPSWHDWALGIADAVSKRADCSRRQVGAVILDEHHTIIATGYNGAPSGQPGCLSGACPRGLHYMVTRPGPNKLTTCACGSYWPCPLAVNPGSSYDTGLGACIAIHAEANALLRAGLTARGCTLYVTEAPCDGCWRLIQGAGIANTYWPNSLGVE